MQERFIYLLEKYYKKKASTSELAEFYSLVASGDFDEVIQNFMDDAYNNAYSATGEVLEARDFYLPGADQRILGNIFATADEPVTRHKTIKLWPRIRVAAAAASVVLGIGIGGYFYIKSAKPVKTQVVNNDITPGKNKAVLTLANGQKISLTDASNGRIANQKGVSIRKTAGGQLIYEAAALSAMGRDAAGREVVEFNTIEAPVGGQWQVILPDGSHVWLNALSSLTYPTNFAGNERRVKLSGQAYFEISHNRKMPFRVESKNQVVEVLGTHFDVMAYADEKLIKTTLLEGSVKISKKGETEILKPGQQAQVAENSMKIQNDVDLEDVVAWKNGYFKFNENLESIMNKVARWYNVDIDYQIKPDPELTFSGKISRSRNISGILKMLEYNGDVHFKIEGRRVIVMQ